MVLKSHKTFLLLSLIAEIRTHLSLSLSLSLSLLLDLVTFMVVFWFDKENMVDLELRGVINVVEACAQTESVEKIVLSSSLLLGSEERMFAWKRMRMRDHGVMQSFAGK